MSLSTSSSKVLLFVIVIVIITYGLLSLKFELFKGNYLKTNFYGEFQNFSLIESIDIVNTGTSHGSVSFDWKIQDKYNAINIARSGQPFSYDLFLLKYYQSKIENAIIIIPLSFHSLCMETTIFSPIDSIYNSTLPFMGLHQTRYSIEFLINHNKDRSFYDDFFEGSEEIKPDYIPTKCSDDIKKTNINYIMEILELFADTNRVIIVTTPYYLPSLGEIQDFENFYNEVYEIVYKFDLEYYDFSRDLRFNSPSFFYNRDHLNTKGRELFTAVFISEVID